jgi:hypothetical protein
MGDVCASCKAPIVWAVTEHGKRMPVDAEPTITGNIVLSHRRAGEPPIALHQPMNALERLAAAHDCSPHDGPLRLFTSHFATCPYADQHRRER